MPSQPIDTGWDFRSVIELIDLDVHDASSPMLRPSPAPSLTSASPENGGVRLGSFAKLYDDLGFLTILPAQIPIDPESEFSNSDDALLPSPMHKDTQILENCISNLGNIQSFGTDDKALEPLLACPVDSDVQAYADGVDSDKKLLDTTGMSKKQRKKARKRVEKEKGVNSILIMEESVEEGKLVQNPVNISKDVCAVETISEKPRAQFSVDTNTEKRPLSPVLAFGETASASATLREEPKTPKTPKSSRPTLSKRPSAPQRGLHRRNQSANKVAITQVPVIAQPIEAQQLFPLALQYPAYGLSTPFQYSLAPQHVAQLEPSQISTAYGHHGLIPRTVQTQTLSHSSAHKIAGIPLSIPAPLKSPAPVQLTNVIQPVIRSQIDRHLNLFNKLLRCFPDDQKWLVAPRQLVNENTSSHGLHVFVDTSNIMYGFKDALRNFGLSQYAMSFDSLALLMERRRPVAKRVSAGSHREAHPVPQVTKIFETSKAVGYESNVTEQVLIVREDSEKKKFFNDVKKLGWHKAQQLRSGSSSDSETGMAAAPKTPPAPKWVEQGVDEILHLKMCQSIIDTEVPSTMVLATGDGAEAEMSDGFLAHVERALKKNWKVELISWRQQTNGGYRNRKFREKWAEHFTVIELDDFLEDIIDTP